MPEYIERKEYVDWLKRYKDKKIIKVVTGLRRVGKSTVFDLYISELVKEGVDPRRIIKINFEELENERLRDKNVLYGARIRRGGGQPVRQRRCGHIYHGLERQVFVVRNSYGFDGAICGDRYFADIFQGILRPLQRRRARRARQIPRLYKRRKLAGRVYV